MKISRMFLANLLSNASKKRKFQCHVQISWVSILTNTCSKIKNIYTYTFGIAVLGSTFFHET
jgi:hypothetical protein